MIIHDSGGERGLRERKKAKTRLLLRDCALRLFRERGYEGTTVEEIASAAEVSTSTFFRYFRAKEDVVLADEYDPLLIEAFRAQPGAVRPLTAFRHALQEVLGDLPPVTRRELHQRIALIQSVPALRSAFLDQLADSLEQFEQLVAQRVGRQAGDPSVRLFAAAVLGVMISVYLHGASEPDADIVGALDQALEALDAGLPF